MARLIDYIKRQNNTELSRKLTASLPVIIADEIWRGIDQREDHKLGLLPADSEVGNV